MADSVVGPAGTVIMVEDVVQQDGTTREMPVSKLHTGDTNVDGGPVTPANPLNTSDEFGSQLLDTMQLHTRILLAIDAKLAVMSGEFPFEE